MNKILVSVGAVVLGVTALFFLSGGSLYAPSRPSVETPEGAIDNDPTRPAGKLPADSLAAKIVGEWRSVEDASMTRIFQENGQFHDEYGGDPAGAPGTWELGTPPTPQKFPPLLLSSEGDIMEFGISVDNSDGGLVLTYVGEGEAQFKRAD